jgi:hypothetical protein
MLDLSKYDVEYVAFNGGFELPSRNIPTSARNGDGMHLRIDGEYLIVEEDSAPGVMSLIPMAATKGIRLVLKPVVAKTEPVADGKPTYAPTNKGARV